MEIGVLLSLIYFFGAILAPVRILINVLVIGAAFMLIVVKAAVFLVIEVFVLSINFISFWLLTFVIIIVSILTFLIIWSVWRGGCLLFHVLVFFIGDFGGLSLLKWHLRLFNLHSNITFLGTQQLLSFMRSQWLEHFWFFDLLYFWCNFNILNITQMLLGPQQHLTFPTQSFSGVWRGELPACALQDWVEIALEF